MHTLTYTVFLPLILLAMQAKGLAFTTPPLDPPFCEDLATLNVQFWHNWSPSPNCIYPGFVPYSWSGGTFPLIDEQGYVLWLNEPEEIKQGNMTPAQAATRYMLYAPLHPTAKIVAANSGVRATGWVQEFYALISPKPYALGIHVYITPALSVAQASSYLDQMHDISQSPIWITEFGTCDGQPATFDALIEMFNSKPYVERYAAYTNRQYGQWYDICPGVDMLDSNGQLTPIGLDYSER